MALCIAVIDDDPACGDLFHEVLSEEGYAVHLFSDGATAVQVLQALAPAAIIVDLRLEHHTAGWEVLTYLQHAPVLQTTPLVVCSADGRTLQEQEQEHAADLRPRAVRLLAKPFDVDEMLGAVQQLVAVAPPPQHLTAAAARWGIAARPLDRRRSPGP